MGEYPFVNIRIDICSNDLEDSVRVYEQRILNDWIIKKDPNWLPKIIAIINNLESKNGE